MKSVVIYYSYTGNCRLISNYIAKALNIDTIELKEDGNRKGLIGFLSSGVQAISHSRMTLLDGQWQDLSAYHTIFLVFPIWASNINPAILTFMDNTDLTGKKLNIISVQASEKVEKSRRALDYLSKFIRYKCGKVYNFVSLTYSEKSKPESISQQLDPFLSKC